jgi:two-component system sensor histidine kinase HydH
MTRTSALHYTWPIVGLSVLLSAACLASIAYIGRLQSDLGESLRADAARLQAAQQAQIHLREYRVHTIVLAAGPTDARRRQVDADRRLFRDSLDALRGLTDGPDDVADLAEVESGWRQYEGELEKDNVTRPAFRSVADLAVWADAHRVGSLLVPCSRLVERSEERMAQTTSRSREQARWAGTGLLVVGLLGPLAGLVGGYAITRGLSRRVARLSVRVWAVRAQLDQDVGEMTLEAPQSLADLDTQLERVVERVRGVCSRLQEQERDLLRAEQLAAVGHLAAGVAHEVRNPLTGIKMLVESAVRPVDPTPLTPADLELIRDEIGRLERTVQGLLDYAKPAPADRRPQDVRRAAARAAEIVAARAERSGAAVEVDVGDESLVARIDSDQFASLLTNLLINALDATPPGGRVRVEGGLTPDRRLVRLSISDSGPGIPAELAGTLFTPFATTKPAGTGLGLAVARRVAVDHGGSLSAADRPGGGACFTVTVPAAEVADAETPGR